MLVLPVLVAILVSAGVVPASGSDFDHRYQRVYNIFDPLLQLRPDNPLNPMQSVSPSNAFNPINELTRATRLIPSIVIALTIHSTRSIAIARTTL